MNIWLRRGLLAAAEIAVAGIGGYYFGGSWTKAFVAASIAAAAIVAVFALRWLFARIRQSPRVQTMRRAAALRYRLSRLRLHRTRTHSGQVLQALVALLAIAALCWLGGVWVTYPVLFLLGVVLSASPIYAIRSADAYEKSGGTDKWVFIFVRRRANRLRNRIKGKTPGGKPLDFIGIVSRGKNFLGEMQVVRRPRLTKEHAEYWELVDDPSGARAPTWVEIHKLALVRLWLWYINLFSDVALVGVNGLYDVYRYPIQKIRYVKKTAGDKDEYEIIAPRQDEESDHVRITPFQWAVVILGAESKDRLSWSLLVVANMRSVNPYVTLHNHENWSQFLTTALVDSLTRGLRKLTIEDVIGLTNGDGLSDEAQDRLIRPVYQIEDRLKTVVGLVFDHEAELEAPGYTGAVQLLSTEPKFRTDADKAAFTQVWRSRQAADSELILGEAEALRESTVIGAVAKEVQSHGEYGVAVQKAQALENAAKTGKATIIFDNQGQVSNVEKLLALTIEEKYGHRPAAPEPAKTPEPATTDGD